MTNILVDSCFWYALFDARDQHHAEAQQMKEYLDYGNIIIPYPVLYETLNTRFSKMKEWMSAFDVILRKYTTLCIPDEVYRKDALDSTFVTAKKRPMALVDMVIRYMLDDVNLNIKKMITFNVGDFDDVCRRKGIEVISGVE